MAGWAAFLLLGCANSDADVSDVRADETSPVQTVINGTFRYSERGVILHELHAGELRREERGNAEVSEDVVEVRSGFELFIGGDAANHEAHMTADWATLDEKNLRLIAKHAVTLENAEGDVLETEYLVWSEDSNRVWTNRPVTIRTADGVIFGEGLESDARFETYRIIKPRGEMVLEGTELR
jgi:LPS export ABC transporter protein LptC